ncbi:MAG: hypothetical protein VR67_08795 [Peptococcaceae bacterium BRH_c8a]|nr:MAG: hypothetical protein VR67_08795 [Peptococcaceae bacterium BRH_c8a]
MDKIRLLITSEDSRVRRGLMIIFNSEKIFEVLGSFNMEESIRKAMLIQPDIILADISGDVNQFGKQVGQIKSECPCSLIIALVADEQLEKIGKIIELGVDGCVPRSIMRVCLVKAVELTCRAGVFCLPGDYKEKFIQSAGALVIDLDQQRAPNSNQNDFLTRREKEILQLVAKDYSNREIASNLFISEPTVKTHVSSILRKLGQKNRSQAIVYAYQTGLLNNPS